jgi:hypothetical protein
MKREELQIGKSYFIVENGESLGEWIWSNDIANGLCFLKPAINDTGEYVNEVYWFNEELEIIPVGV